MSDRRAHSRTAFALICASLMLAAVPPASAGQSQSAAKQQSIAVDSRDINLTTERGRAQLQARIDHAVDRICGSSHERSTSALAAYANCSKVARADAQVQFDAQVAAALDARKMAGDRAMPVR